FARFAGVPEGAIHLLPNPIHVDRIGRLAEEELPIGVRGPYFLAIGRLHPQKDFGLLLEAFSFLVNGHPEVQLVILGDGPERGYLEEVSRQLGIRDRVSFLGFVANPYPYLRRAKALVVTSRYEGMPMAVLEALALQIPVLAARSRGGLEEALGNGRFGLITPRSAEALADGMRRLLSSSFEWDIASLEEHLRWFSVDNALRAYLGVLEQIWR
ncbi:MAG: glycosyltransferase, partial [Candidatus Bipolaricaulaceae bacterium]